MQLSLCGDRRIDLAQRSGRGIARVGVEGKPGRFPAGVQRSEIVVAHIHLAADFDVGRSRAVQ